MAAKPSDLTVPVPIPGIPIPVPIHVPGTGDSGGIHLPGPGSVIGGVKDVAGFVSALSSPNTWIRVAEVVVGFLLIGVGIDAMLKGAPTDMAKKAGKAAAKAGELAALA